MIKASIKILFYAINGTGLGHLSRLLALARMTRELGRSLDQRADFQFLTTSEAPQIAWDFPVYKLPSKSVVVRTDTFPRSFTANAKFLVSNLVAAFRPDILVMDTVPSGSFNEFFFLKDYAKKSVFINRHKNRSYALDAAHQSHLALYDLILVPDHQSEEHRYPLASNLTDRCVFIGPVHGYRAEEASPRDEVRRMFAVEAEQKVVYVSAGGGGDKQAEEELECLVKAVSQNPQHFVLVGYGPLYQGRRLYRRNVVPLAEVGVNRWLKGVDLAICAAGYNTYQELLAAGVPTAFYAQKKGLDRQDERIQLGLDRGWHRVLTSFDPVMIRLELEALQDEANRLAIAEALHKRKKAEGALQGAVELLKLQATLPNSTLKRRQVFVVAGLRQVWSEVATEFQSADKTKSVDFEMACKWAHYWQEVCFVPPQIETFYDHSLLAWAGTEAETQTTWRHRNKALLAWGHHLAAFQKESDLGEGDFRRFLKACVLDVRGNNEANIEARKRLLANVLDTLPAVYPSDQLARLLVLMQKKLKPSELVPGLIGLVATFDQESAQDIQETTRNIAQLAERLENVSERLTVTEFEALSSH